MSEANIPPNNQDSAEATEPQYLDWPDIFNNSAVEIANDEEVAIVSSAGDTGEPDPNSLAEAAPVQPSKVDAEGWATIEFPGAIVGIDALEAESVPTDAAAELESSESDTQPTLVEPEPELTPSPRELELMALVRDLNQCNDQLLSRVAQLETSLEESQLVLEAEMTRSQAQASKCSTALKNCNYELRVSQEQVGRLKDELEFANQAHQRQQIRFETLTAELESGQQQIAQIERECAMVQQRYNEQCHTLSQADSNCRDLQNRLQRQQRYTLQFKAALEKSLEVPPPNYDSGNEMDDDSADSTLAPKSQTHVEFMPQMFRPKVKRIQPWSSHASISNQGQSLGDFSRSLPLSVESSPAIATDVMSSSELERADDGDDQLEAEEQLWDDLAKLIDTQTASSSSDAVEPLVTAHQVKQEAPDPDQILAEPVDLEVSPGLKKLAEAQVAAESSPLLMNPVLTKEQQGQAEDLTAFSLNASGPSPVVYPLRPQKKIKSLAAVDLPTFPRRQSN
ncbi:MAG: hypothetical protein F6K19_16950 [Cyanothece sp. SIO1E1]|nr:hypothetical protein [Cyanothece sp. SIO1E1]